LAVNLSSPCSAARFRSRESACSARTRLTRRTVSSTFSSSTPMTSAKGFPLDVSNQVVERREAHGPLPVPALDLPDVILAIDPHGELGLRPGQTEVPAACAARDHGRESRGGRCAGPHSASSGPTIPRTGGSRAPEARQPPSRTRRWSSRSRPMRPIGATRRLFRRARSETILRVLGRREIAQRGHEVDGGAWKFSRRVTTNMVNLSHDYVHCQSAAADVCGHHNDAHERWHERRRASGRCERACPS